MINRLQDQLNDGVRFANMRDSPSVAFFRGSVLKTANHGYNKRAGNEKDERMRIMKPAENVIREDILMTPYNTTGYPGIINFTENVESIVPETLEMFLQGVIAKNRSDQQSATKKMYSYFASNHISYKTLLIYFALSTRPWNILVL